MLAPLLLALPPEFMSVTPNSSAFGGGDEAGADTLMSTPEVVWPAVTLITPAAAEPPPPVGGAGPTAAVGVGLPPPQPAMDRRAARNKAKVAPLDEGILSMNNPASNFER